MSVCGVDAGSSEPIDRCCHSGSFGICLSEDGRQLELGDDTARVVSEPFRYRLVEVGLERFHERNVERLKPMSGVGRQAKDEHVVSSCQVNESDTLRVGAVSVENEEDRVVGGWLGMFTRCLNHSTKISVCIQPDL